MGRHNDFTIKLADVARHVGVSLASVSRVLNNSGPISETMRRRVEESISDLGYQPTRSHTRTKETNGTIALVIADILNPVFAEVIRGVKEETGHENLTMILVDTHEDEQQERRALRQLAERPVDGVIVFGSRLSNKELITFFEQYGLPLVIINRKIEHPGIPSILVDSSGATYRATQHLLNLKHTRIGFFPGPASSDSSRTRRQGVVQALADAGLELRPQWCPVSFPNIEGGFQAMSAMLALPVPERPTAIITYNDMMALGVLHAIRTYGLNVPRDISVIGFDDLTIAAHANPPLTTIALPTYQMGHLAMKLLRRVWEDRSIPSDGYVLLESRLVIRESTTWRAAEIEDS